MLPACPGLRLMARTAQRARPYLRKAGRPALRGTPPAFQRAERIAHNVRTTLPHCTAEHGSKLDLKTWLLLVLAEEVWPKTTL